MFAAQESFAEDFATRILTDGSFVRVNTTLTDEIALDDAQKAIASLPPLADEAFERTRRDVIDLISSRQKPSAAQPVSPTRRRQYISKELIEAAGLSAFYPSRAYYSHRDGASSIDQYIATARNSLVMVSINLSTGLPMDGMLDVIRRKLESPGNDFTATISLLNPRRDALMNAVAPALDLTPEELAESTSKVVTKLVAFRNDLSGQGQRRLRLRLHDALPFGSAIMLDHTTLDGRIQIETKSYRTPGRKSFAFELMATDKDEDLYATLLTAYSRLIDDGCDMDTM